MVIFNFLKCLQVILIHSGLRFTAQWWLIRSKLPGECADTLLGTPSSLLAFLFSSGPSFPVSSGGLSSAYVVLKFFRYKFWVTLPVFIGLVLNHSSSPSNSIFLAGLFLLNVVSGSSG